MSRFASPLHLAFGLGLALGLGLASACFTAPNDPVLFSCEFGGKDSCPPDYECRADNCCHQIGTSDDDQVGACALGGNTGMSATGTSGTGTGTETGAGMDTGTDTTGTGGSDTTG